MNAVRLRHARQDFLQLFDRDDIISYCVSIERNYGTTETDDNNIRGRGRLIRIGLDGNVAVIERNYGTTETDDNNIRGRGRLIRIGLDGNVAVDDDDDDDANKIYHLHAYLKFKSNHFLADVREYLTNLKFELAREASARVRFSQKDVCYRNWTMDVCQWWNRYCCDAVRFEFKRPCLYLYGRSDVGKTTYVESLIGRHNLRYVFRPDVGKTTYVESLIGRHNLRYVFRPGIGNFFMQDFRADFHRVILFEEFDCKAHNLSLLRRLCEGRQHAFPVKCERDLLVAFRGPIIFVTNFDDVENEALRSRLLFVHASVPYWQSERVDVPKAEEERNVISSTSSRHQLTHC
ncbi:hypothetical protein QE152_g33894 [Popillia japonica]|uniref:Uncharacterized protein n=1 Tax=Popillia japonica TaxID=7064 RepID=A0AAW1IVI9_POPJA